MLFTVVCLPSKGKFRNDFLVYVQLIKVYFHLVNFDEFIPTRIIASGVRYYENSSGSTERSREYYVNLKHYEYVLMLDFNLINVIFRLNVVNTYVMYV